MMVLESFLNMCFLLKHNMQECIVHLNYSETKYIFALSKFLALSKFPAGSFIKCAVKKGEETEVEGRCPGAITTYECKHSSNCMY